MAISESMIARKNLEPDHTETYQQYQYMFPELAMVRMGRWNDILQDTASINTDWTYAAILDDFAKGMAYAKTGNINKAQKHLEMLRSKMKDTSLQVRSASFSNTAFECIAVPENILYTAILFEQKNYDAALSAINKAIAAEDKLTYLEPKQWLLPARQYLGAYLLQLHRAKEAEAVYREDLVWNPGNGWSLLGLYPKPYIAQNKTSEAEKYKAEYMHSFAKAEIMPTVSAY